MSDPVLHPDCGPLAFLLGTWRGAGTGEYPTIRPFEYEEEVRFWHVGKPHLLYAQRTSSRDKGPLHSEMGYWRPVAGDGIELVLAHPTGVVEIAEGRISGTSIDVASTTVAGTGTAKEVTRLERTFEVTDGVMRYALRMAAVGQPLTTHLVAELHRAD